MAEESPEVPSHAIAEAVESSLKKDAAAAAGQGEEEVEAKADAWQVWWTRDENRRFEDALARYNDQSEETDRWQRVAELMGGSKSLQQVQRHYDMLLEDVESIEAGRVALPPYPVQLPSSQPSLKHHHSGSFFSSSAAPLPKNSSSKACLERRKGLPWTPEEHRRFLLGLKRFGKGDWRSISRNCVMTRTPTQVASHAQKFFNRHNSVPKDKRRSSIHDITSFNDGESLEEMGPSHLSSVSQYAQSSSLLS